MDTLMVFVVRWLRECDRCGPAMNLDDTFTAGLNMMQSLGFLLCLTLHSGLRKDTEECIDNFDVFVATAHVKRSVAVKLHADDSLNTFRWDQVVLLVSSMQTEFEDLYSNTRHLNLLFLAVMKRVGFFLVTEFDTSHLDGSTQQPRAPTLINIQSCHETAPGWCRIQTSEVKHVLAAVHAMWSLSLILRNATVTPPWNPTDGDTHIQGFHREASLDTYTDILIASSCPIGATTQYKEKFSHLFHSVSQVVYYNFPNFRRTGQMELDELLKPNCPPINLLPVLLELYPEIPVLYEHTGALHNKTHSKHPWSWVVLAGYVLLVDEHMQAFHSSDLRSLLVHRASHAKPS